MKIFTIFVILSRCEESSLNGCEVKSLFLQFELDSSHPLRMTAIASLKFIVFYGVKTLNLMTIEVPFIAKTLKQTLFETYNLNLTIKEYSLQIR